MGFITDLLKEVPLGAVVKERLEATEQKYAELEREHASAQGMESSHLLLRRGPPSAVSFGAAVLSVAIAVIVVMWMEAERYAAAPVSLFLCAILFSAWLGGMGPGLLAIVLSSVAFDYFFLPPTYSLAVETGEWPGIFLYVLAAVFVVSFSVAQRNRAKSLGKINEALQAENLERRGLEERLRLDITERTQAEEALRVATARFKDILDMAHDAIISVDSRQRIILFNQGAQKLFGFTQADVIGSQLERLLPDDVRDVHRKHIEEFRRSPDAARTMRQKRSVHGRRKDGSEFLAEASISKLNIGEELVYTVILRDVTERKRMEQALRENEARLQGILDHSPALIFLKDLAGRYLLVNREFEKIAHLSPAQIVSKTDEEIFSPEQAHAFRANDLEVLRADVPMEFEEIALHDDGLHTSIVFKFPLKNAEGETYAVGGIATDITQRRRAEDALRKAEADLVRVNRLATLGALTASIAHEVNQPLGAMVTSAASCSRWLSAQPPDLQRAQRALDRIVRDGNRASNVVARIRALVQRQLPRKDMVDLNEAILEVLALVRSEAQSSGVSLKAELAKDLPAIPGDRVQLQQVVINLVVNAIEAMSGIDDRPRELAISSREDELNGMLIAVRDSGRGLPTTGIDQLFEVFYTTKPDGIGIGLSISRSIVEAHGGRLWVSPNVPYGAVFQFSLPVDDERP